MAEIGRDKWLSFFKDFGMRHKGWLTSIETRPHQADQLRVERLPLQNIVAVLPREGIEQITLLLNRSSGVPLQYVVMKPIRIRFDGASGTTRKTIEIDTLESATTIFHFGLDNWSQEDDQKI